MPNAGYYFMQNACEPVHIQFNPIDSKVVAINRTYRKVRGITAKVELFGIDSKSLFREEKSIDLGETDIKEISSLSSSLAGSKGVVFVVLNLKNSTGRVISHNVYWISNDNQFKSLSELPKTKVDVKMLSAKTGVNEKGWTIKISNTSDKIAFFVRPQLMSGGEEVLPSYWTGSYFTLAPSESTTISVSCPVSKIKGAKPHILVSGWSIDPVDMKLN
jgi:hypothetical protein